MIVRGQLIAKNKDAMGYTTYVFKNLDSDNPRYIMATQFPNWDQKPIEPFDKGFVEYKEIEAGKDHWYNNSSFIPYRYDMVQLIKFIHEKDKPKNTYLLD